MVLDRAPPCFRYVPAVAQNSKESAKQSAYRLLLYIGDWETQVFVE